MTRQAFEDWSCPMARALGRVGDGWSVLILREALYGTTRFDDFRTQLGIAPNILTRRLKALVEDGLLEKSRYSSHPPRDEYHLTETGRDFRPVLLALLVWGNRHFSPDGPTILLRDMETGAEVTPVLVDEATGESIRSGRHRIVPGPAASDGLRARLARRPVSASLPPAGMSDSTSDSTGRPDAAWQSTHAHAALNTSKETS